MEEITPENNKYLDPHWAELAKDPPPIPNIPTQLPPVDLDEDLDHYK